MGDHASRVSDRPYSVSRTVPRFRFIAEAEVTRAVDGMRLVARLSELSEQGCYIDTPEAFAEGTALRVRIRYGGSTCELPGAVIYAHKGWGMGVLFGDVGPAQEAVLSAWLSELSRKASPRSGRNTSTC